MNAPALDTAPRITYVQDGDPWLRSAFIDTLERLTGRVPLEAIYHRLKRESFNPQTFFGRALELARIRYHVTHLGTAEIPRQGPLVFVANHPFGVVDGVMLCDLAARTRGDFRILINALLCRDADLDRFFLPIDFAASRAALQTNITSKRAALRLLGDGGTVLVFPAGGISTRGRGGFGKLQDLTWTTFTAKLILQSRATVVPVFFHGENGRLFHVASNLSPTLRAALLLREARNKLGREFALTVGEPIPHEQLAHHSRTSLTAHLHAVTWGMQNAGDAAAPAVS